MRSKKGARGRILSAGSDISIRVLLDNLDGLAKQERDGSNQRLLGQALYILPQASGKTKRLNEKRVASARSSAILATLCR
jgi:hypothetical protein